MGEGIEEARFRLFQLRPINFLARRRAFSFFLPPLPLVMNTSFASSVQHSGRKNKYPAVKSALLLLLLFFLVFRWWIVHQEVGTELHFSRWRYTYIHIYIYVHSRRTRSFRIPCIGRIKFVHGRNGLRFLKLR